MFQDARFALRLIAQRPGVAALVTFTLAIGVAASTVVFSLADAILWHPVPFRDPSRLVHVRAVPPGESEARQVNVPRTSIDAWPARRRVIASVHMWAMRSVVLGRDEDAEEITAAALSAGLLSELGARLQRGRDFDAGDGDRGVAIISDGLWQARFGRSPDALGQSILLDGAPHIVIGVLASGFAFPVNSIKLWLPMAPPTAATGSVRAIARLRSDVTFEQAAAFVASTAPGVQGDGRILALRITPLVTVNVATSKAIVIMLGGVLCVLLIAIANAGNILLAEAVQRGGEFAVRRSLGASRARLVQQIFVEALLRSSLVVIVALPLAYWTLAVIVDAIPRLLSFQSLRAIALDWRSLVFCTGVAVAAGCAAGLAPFAQRTKADVVSALKGSTAQTSARSRTREALAATQLAATLVLLVAAGLLVNGFVRLIHVDAGFGVDGLSAVPLSFPATRFSDAATARQSLRRLKSEALRLPGVVSAAVSDAVPPQMSFMELAEFDTGDGRSIARPDALVSFAAVDESFFTTLQAPIVRGRAFTAGDADGEPGVAIVSRALAQHLWPGADALGRQFRPDPQFPWLTVVGIAGDIANGGFDFPRGELTFYTPRPPANLFWRRQLLIVRVSSGGSAASLGTLVRRVIPGAPVGAVQPASELIAAEHARVHFATMLMSGLAAVALVLALVGVYGAFWSAVRQRTREIGVRLAIGAAPHDIVTMMLSSSARVAIIGLAIGLPLAMAVARSLRSFLFEVSPADPLTLGAVSAGLLAAALAAAYVPARRASRIDPTDALRTE